MFVGDKIVHFGIYKILWHYEKTKTFFWDAFFELSNLFWYFRLFRILYYILYILDLIKLYYDIIILRFFYSKVLGLVEVMFYLVFLNFVLSPSSQICSKYCTIQIGVWGFWGISDYSSCLKLMIGIFRDKFLLYFWLIPFYSPEITAVVSCQVLLCSFSITNCIMYCYSSWFS